MPYKEAIKLIKSKIPEHLREWDSNKYRIYIDIDVGGYFQENYVGVKGCYDCRYPIAALLKRGANVEAKKLLGYATTSLRYLSIDEVGDNERIWLRADWLKKLGELVKQAQRMYHYAEIAEEVEKKKEQALINFLSSLGIGQPTKRGEDWLEGSMRVGKLFVSITFRKRILQIVVRPVDIVYRDCLTVQIPVKMSLIEDQPEVARSMVRKIITYAVNMGAVACKMN